MDRSFLVISQDDAKWNGYEAEKVIIDAEEKKSKKNGGPGNGHDSLE